MDDQEYAWRRQAIVRMSASCICAEEVPVKRGSVGRGRIDVLCKPKLQDLAKLTLAIEVKAHRVVGDRQLGPWLKQAADYVGAEPENGWPPIVAAFIWLVGVQLNSDSNEQLRMDGMVQLAQ